MYLNEIKCRKVIDLELANERAFRIILQNIQTRKIIKLKGHHFTGSEPKSFKLPLWISFYNSFKSCFRVLY